MSSSEEYLARLMAWRSGGEWPEPSLDEKVDLMRMGMLFEIQTLRLIDLGCDSPEEAVWTFINTTQVGQHAPGKLRAVLDAAVKEGWGG